MLLMCQEFTVPDTMRLWDSLLSADAHNIMGERQDDNPLLSPIKYQFIDFISAAMVYNLSKEIIKADDFSDIMEMLQEASDFKYLESINNLLQKTHEVTLAVMRHEIKAKGYHKAQYAIKYEKVLTYNN